MTTRSRLTRALIAAISASGLLMSGRTIVSGQAPAAPGTASDKGAVIGTGTFTGFVENMDRSLAFYRDAFGMDVPPLPASGERPYDNAKPRLFAMFAIPGARERHQSARVPGTRVNVELMEIQNVDHQTIPMRSQDPGTVTVVLIVRDLDAALARARQANAAIVTPGGMPVRFSYGTRAVLIRDLDERLIELRQPAEQRRMVRRTTSRTCDSRLPSPTSRRRRVSTRRCWGSRWTEKCHSPPMHPCARSPG